ncbi:MAG: CCA tRNA nucleotidyltransferase [Planctomycetaceae bacterium]
MNFPHLVRDHPQYRFAVEIVVRLRKEGFDALWAGGCVRDLLLGKTPKDYDVASTATPEDVIRVFGSRRTVAVGASFGVVMVLGAAKSAGQVEVATFRSDGEYLDGRRPSSVRFCRPEEDARRRDFTINGMFFDPIDETVIDYVGGREDLAAGIVRAIGDPLARFTEDKLRMLRAVRFTATYGFALDSATSNAVVTLRRELIQVSVERIAQELRRMLSHASRSRAFRLLQQTQLLPEILPEICHETFDSAWDDALRLASLENLTSTQFEPAFALIVRSQLRTGNERKPLVAIESICRRLKFSNEETECVCWLVSSLPILADIGNQPLHIRKPLFAAPHFELLLQMSEAIAAAESRDASEVTFCRDYIASLNGDELCPPSLVDGQDLIALNVPRGPAFRALLTTIRNEQLDEILTTRSEALERLRELVNAGTVG